MDSTVRSLKDTKESLVDLYRMRERLRLESHC